VKTTFDPFSRFGKSTTENAGGPKTDGPADVSIMPVNNSFIIKAHCRQQI